jgi:hypothetical protein
MSDLVRPVGDVKAAKLQLSKLLHGLSILADLRSRLAHMISPASVSLSVMSS